MLQQGQMTVVFIYIEDYTLTAYQKTSKFFQG